MTTVKSKKLFEPCMKSWNYHVMWITSSGAKIGSVAIYRCGSRGSSSGGSSSCGGGGSSGGGFRGGLGLSRGRANIRPCCLGHLRFTHKARISGFGFPEVAGSVYFTCIWSRKLKTGNIGAVVTVGINKRWRYDSNTLPYEFKVNRFLWVVWAANIISFLNNNLPFTSILGMVVSSKKTEVVMSNLHHILLINSSGKITIFTRWVSFIVGRPKTVTSHRRWRPTTVSLRRR